MRTLDETTFGYLQPTDEQLETMKKCRIAAHTFATHLDELLPDGPDKTYVLRALRTVAMWANIAVTRQADGSPRR